MSENKATSPVKEHVLQTEQKKKGSSSLLTILLLIFLYPLGVLVMWLEGKWSRWVRILISAPFALLLLLIILSPILLIVINPARRFSEANNTKRQYDVNLLLQVITQYNNDNKDTPENFHITPEKIAKSGADLCNLLVPKYIDALPTDPQSSSEGNNITDCASSYDSGYTAKLNAKGQIVITAPLAEIEVKIEAPTSPKK